MTFLRRRKPESGRDDSEIVMDLHLQHYPLRDWAGMWNEMKAIVGSYNKNSARNEKDDTY